MSGSSPGYGYGWMRGYWMTRPTITWRGFWRAVFLKTDENGDSK